VARTESELVEGLKHVRYELLMVVGTVSQLSGWQRSTYLRSPALDNSLVESMLLHTRSLAEFFLSNSPRRDDINQSQFVENWTPGPDAAVITVKAEHGRLNKHLSHLTWPRFDDGLQKWDVWSLASAVVQIAADWSNHLRREGKQVFYAEFNPLVDDARKILEDAYPAYAFQPGSYWRPGP
jgi:hypothetical protein